MPSRSRFSRTYTPFSRWSAHLQRDAWIRLRTRIRAASPWGQENLYLGRHLDEPDRPVLWNQWDDITFLGLDGRTIWNAALITVRRELWGEVDGQARDEVRARLSEEDRRAESADLDNMFVKSTHNGRPVYELRFIERRHPSLDGKTTQEAEQDVARRIMQSPPPVFEKWTFHRDYAYGIGLHATLEVDEITPATLKAFVERFRDEGERAYCASAPATRFLPTQTEHDTLGAEAAWASSRPLDL